MVVRIKQPHGGAIQNFEPGECGNRRGRPLTLKTQLKKAGFTVDEMRRQMKHLMSLSTEELKVLRKDPKSTVLDSVFSSVLERAIRTGKLESVDILLSRAYGKKAYEEEKKLDIVNPMALMNTAIPDDPVEASRAYQQIMGE